MKFQLAVLFAFSVLGSFLAQALESTPENDSAFQNRYYTCYAQTPDGTLYSASGYGSADRIQQQALDVCVAQAHYNCKRAGCKLAP